MKKLIKSILSQQVINNFYHLPKAILANIFFGFPTQKLKVIGVTGTDGKTTTTNMVYQILKAAGKKASMVSTINAIVGGESFDTGFHVTSPDPFMVQKFAKQALDNGDEYLILEVTSHALDQYRFWGIKFDVGLITNITHEHLDYHKIYQNYFDTKAKLIEDVNFAIVNHNLKQKITRKVFTFGLDKGDFNQKEVKLKLKIPGDYNLENALAALSVAFALGIDKTSARKALENFTGITGRMEEVKNNRGIKIFIDFAHTPNALTQALTALREQTKGRLIAVFGSAGKRDVEKRGLMGVVAGKLADIVVITAEDPRGELEVINKQIVEGAKKSGKVLAKNIFVVEDREKAIDFAINETAKKGDTVGIFGKGHEASMNLDGKREIPWSDVKVVKSVLSGSSQQ
ncbi:MAG: UDP-N-acetylmuramoyl-L-alanyl-D-glutamate--2,6-diaminopimelate ligase [Patescibacteria group bacterium]|nr:UDP-N-acetylmuramoyl-L-alanyl-D-glutamate--2,6-diaminopimelate ligase [Patescibacteria group bacterium]